MNNDTHSSSGPIAESTRTDAPVKRPYRRPKLTMMGDVRDITLGPSFGTLESGAPTSRKVSFGAPSEFEPLDE